MLDWDSCLDYGSVWRPVLLRISNTSVIGDTDQWADRLLVSLWLHFCSSQPRPSESLLLHVRWTGGKPFSTVSSKTSCCLPDACKISPHMFVLPFLHLPLPPCHLSRCVPSTLPLLAVCYSCWSNLENVPNPLSVLRPQRNIKWIRQDYRLPLAPPPPSRPPLPLLHLCAVTLLIIPPPLSLHSHVHLSPDISLFIGRIKAFSLSRWQIGSNVPPATDALAGPVHHGT